MFTTLKVDVIAKGRDRRIAEDFTYENDKYKITLKRGFVTNGASIPKIFWSILSSPFDGPIIYAACVHDGLYTKRTLPRKECDKLLIEMARENGYSKIKSFLVYNAVRIFGGSHWHKNSESQKELIEIIKK